MSATAGSVAGSVAVQGTFQNSFIKLGYEQKDLNKILSLPCVPSENEILALHQRGIYLTTFVEQKFSFYQIRMVVEGEALEDVTKLGQQIGNSPVMHHLSSLLQSKAVTLKEILECGVKDFNEMDVKLLESRRYTLQDIKRIHQRKHVYENDCVYVLLNKYSLDQLAPLDYCTLSALNEGLPLEDASENFNMSSFELSKKLGIPYRAINALPEARRHLLEEGFTYKEARGAKLTYWHIVAHSMGAIKKEDILGQISLDEVKKRLDQEVPTVSPDDLGLCTDGSVSAAGSPSAPLLLSAEAQGLQAPSAIAVVGAAAAAPFAAIPSAAIATAGR